MCGSAIKKRGEGGLSMLTVARTERLWILIDYNGFPRQKQPIIIPYRCNIQITNSIILPLCGS